MTGSLQIKKNIYYVVINITDENDNKKQKWISTKISSIGNHKREAEKEFRNILNEYENKNVTYSKDISFSEWLEKWLESMRYRVEINTFEGYESYVKNHLKPYFDKKKVTLATIAPKHIQDYYAEKLKNGRCDGKGGLSPNSIKRHGVVINSALEQALRMNLIPYNPSKRTTLPKNINKFKGKFYNESQINQMLTIIKDTPIESAVILATFYGLRRSEICGLKWGCVDFDDGTVTIKNTVVMTKTLLEKERTKNKTSYRTLPLFEDVKNYLEQLKIKQSKLQLLQGSSYIRNDYINKWEDGRPLSPNFISNKFKKILKENNMPVIRFHDLRHTTASLLISKGFSLKEIQEYLGHCNISCTADIYGHLEYKSKINMANQLNNTINFANVMSH